MFPNTRNHFRYLDNITDNGFTDIDLFRFDEEFFSKSSQLNSFMDINTLGQLPLTIFSRITDRTNTKNRIHTTPVVRHIPRLSDQVLQEEGKNVQTKNEATKKEEDKQTVTDLVKKSNRRVISISSLFPWDIFPNTIEVEESRVTFIFRQFLTSQTHSVDIKDISNVFIQTSPFFATLQIVSRTFVQNDITIGHLERKKALRVHMIIEGLRTFVEHAIDTSNYTIGELIAKIEEFHKNKTL